MAFISGKCRSKEFKLLMQAPAPGRSWKGRTPKVRTGARGLNRQAKPVRTESQKKTKAKKAAGQGIGHLNIGKNRFGNNTLLTDSWTVSNVFETR